MCHARSITVYIEYVTSHIKCCHMPEGWGLHEIPVITASILDGCMSVECHYQHGAFQMAATTVIKTKTGLCTGP